MMLLILMMFAGPAENGQIVSNLEIYNPEPICALGEHGDLFILDRENHRLIKIDASMKRSTIGRRGQGPGELEGPDYFFISGKHLVVRDRNLSLFDLDGNFIKRIKPETNARMSLLFDGYLVTPTEIEKNHFRLTRTNFDFSESMELYSWKDEPMQTAPPEYAFNATSARYNPAMESVRYLPDPQRNLLYVLHAGRPARISVIQVVTAEVSEFKLPLEPVPMNLDWARAEIKRRNSPDSQIKLELDEQDYFPFFKKPRLGPAAELVLELWTYDPRVKKDYYLCDASGRKLELEFDPALCQRIIGISTDQMIWLGAWDEDLGFYLVQCPRDQVKAMAEKHPWKEKERGSFIRLK